MASSQEPQQALRELVEQIRSILDSGDWSMADDTWHQLDCVAKDGTDAIALLDAHAAPPAISDAHFAMIELAIRALPYRGGLPDDPMAQQWKDDTIAVLRRELSKHAAPPAPAGTCATCRHAHTPDAVAMHRYGIGPLAVVCHNYESPVEFLPSYRAVDWGCTLFAPRPEDGRAEGGQP